MKHIFVRVFIYFGVVIVAFTLLIGLLFTQFNQNEDGTYTITVSPEGVEMAYLHLIDNMTGADIDLLTPNAVIADSDPDSINTMLFYEIKFM